MDCEKFEPLLLDELYEELDELTSAAVKRHVSGCARCASSLNGLRATRRLAALPLVELPEGLEDRILAATKEAQKVVPIKSRFSRALSWGGSWAMRPQTAMAAVFLLMIGTSAFLLRKSSYSPRDSAVSVTVEGNPSPTAAAPATKSELDDKAAAAAHGPGSPNNTTLPPAATSTASALALADESAGPVAAIAGGKRDQGGADDGTLAALAAAEKKNEAERNANGYLANKQAAAPAPPIGNAGPPAGAPGGGGFGNDPTTSFAAGVQQPPAPAKAGGQSRRGPGDNASDPFSLGAAAFRARSYAEATKHFDAAAQGGDANAALWAARSTKEGQGCAVALGRFEKVAATAGWIGHEASLEAAKCQIAMGQLDPARDRLNKLTQVASHQTQAQHALNELNQVAAKKASGGGGGGAAAGAARATHAPPRPAAAPVPNHGSEKASEKKAVDHQSPGF